MENEAPQGYILAWLSEITRKQEKQEIPTPRLKAPDVEGVAQIASV